MFFAHTESSALGLVVWVWVWMDGAQAFTKSSPACLGVGLTLSLSLSLSFAFSLSGFLSGIFTGHQSTFTKHPLPFSLLLDFEKKLGYGGAHRSHDDDDVRVCLPHTTRRESDSQKTNQEESMYEKNGI